MRRWNGWGDSANEFPLTGDALAFLRERIGAATPPSDASILRDAAAAVEALEAELSTEAVCARLCKSLVFLVGATACQVSAVDEDYLVDVTSHALRDVSLGVANSGVRNFTITTSGTCRPGAAAAPALLLAKETKARRRMRRARPVGNVRITAPGGWIEAAAGPRWYSSGTVQAQREEAALSSRPSPVFANRLD